MAVVLDDYRWLVSEDAVTWLTKAANASQADARLVQHLRKDLPAERAALVLEQVELRRRAKAKFALAHQMFFTPRGLEQATDERLAAYKAQRFTPGTHVGDLCCGIGGDLLALARRGPAIGLDLDPVVAILASANLRLAGAEGTVTVGDAAGLSAFPASKWHCDPDRRATGRRSTRIEQFSPTLEALESLRARQPEAAIKLAPATIAPSLWTQQAELEWLGSRGECRQQVVWFGDLARYHGRRAATMVERGAPRTVVGDAADELPVARQYGKYLYEPHSAVLAAKLASTLCVEHGLSAIANAIAYLTGDALIDDAALAAFELVDVLPFDRKRVKAYCRQHRLGRLEVKKRGVDADPNRLARELASSGDEQAVILLAPVQGRAMALIARRVDIADHANAGGKR